MLPVKIVKSGRFTGKYHATIEGVGDLPDGFRGTGDTKADSQTALRVAILTQSAQNQQRAYLFAKDDNATVFCVHYAEGWQYDIISPSTLRASTWRCNFGCVFPAKSFEEAKERAKVHIDRCFGGVKAIVQTGNKPGHQVTKKGLKTKKIVGI